MLWIKASAKCINVNVNGCHTRRHLQHHEHHLEHICGALSGQELFRGQTIKKFGLMSSKQLSVFVYPKTKITIMLIKIYIF